MTHVQDPTTPSPAEPITTLWVDADACPRAARDILVRAAERTATPTWFVANHQVPLPRSVHVKALSVPAGADAADQLIVERARPGDMVITSDLPLALEAIEKGALVMTSRGETLDANNIRAKGSDERDFMEEQLARSSGEHTGGPSAYGQREQRDFSGNALPTAAGQGQTNQAVKPKRLVPAAYGGFSGGGECPALSGAHDHAVPRDPASGRRVRYRSDSPLADCRSSGS